jgi:poly-gamma-glutamate capsule biosynthesis protein CapA/YwtB (metallophosphatase superfamily)
MKPSVSIILAATLFTTAIGLTACGKKDSDTGTNIVEMNASDGSMNDMTVVESATLDQAGAAAADNGAAEADNASNAQ